MTEKFVDADMNTMIIAYHGEEGLPKVLKDQPADAVEKAALWLKKYGFEKIGLWGISIGENAKRPLEGSAFSWHGQSLPFMKYIPSDGKAWSKIYKKQSWIHKEPYSRGLLEDAYAANNNPGAVIPIWNIHGPVVLLGSYQDSMRPDEKTVPRLVRRTENSPGVIH